MILDSEIQPLLIHPELHDLPSSPTPGAFSTKKKDAD